MGKNQLILLLVTLTILFLSGFLFYQGLAPIFNSSRQILPTPIASDTPVLGEQRQNNVSERAEALVTRVIDGDTIETKLDEQTVKIRYIGIDTPESVDPRRAVECFGKEASGENKRLVEGKKVYLEKDVSETDKYGRLLRYIYLPLSDGSLLFVNDYLIRQGFANVLTFPPDLNYVDRFLDAEKEARENLRGLWNKCKK